MTIKCFFLVVDPVGIGIMLFIGTLSPKLMDFDQTCTYTSLGVRLLIDYGDIVAIFKVI